MYNFKDYYKILQVDSSAELTVIEAAFKKLSLKYHPDVNTTTEGKYKEITEAYFVLKDPQKRQNYDNKYFKIRNKFNNNLNNINVQDNISDIAGIIEIKYITKIDKLIKNIEEMSSTEIAVITINSLGGELIDKFALRLFNKFGVGKKDKNNGILFLISKEDNQFRIEVGSGLEDIINNNFLQNLIDNFILPSFRYKRFGQGILKFVKIIATKLLDE